MIASRRCIIAGGLGAAVLAVIRANPLDANSGVRAMSTAIAAVPPEETFEGTWPFRARYSEAPGYRAHYIDQGSGRETLLLIHGEPTWSYLFRKQIPVWAERYRVLAVDHMGFGKSAAPQDRTYWLQDHIDNLERLVLELDLSDLTLVMHDFGGPAGMGLAIRHPDRIKRIISVNGPTPAGQPDVIHRVTASGAVSPWFQWILKAEKEGILEQVLGATRLQHPLDAEAQRLRRQQPHHRHLAESLPRAVPDTGARGGRHRLGERLRRQCAPLRAAGRVDEAGACGQAGAGDLGRAGPDAAR